MTSDEEFEFVPEKSRSLLSHRQRVQYNQYRKAHLTWLLEEGKTPERTIGYSESEVDSRASRLDQIYRWVWDEFDTKTMALTHEHADAVVDGLEEDELRRRDTDEPYCEDSKRKIVNTLESYFEWRARERGGEEWESEITFDQSTYRRPDPFTKAERRKLRETALDYKSIPNYGSLTPDERDRWKRYLAQELGKPKADIIPADWETVNRDWKIPSLVYTSLDAGFRPIEVARSTTDWLRLEKGTIYIPKEESSKNRENWEVALREETVEILRRWKDQRDAHSKYDDTDAIWLTREGNRYTSASLNYLLDNLCEEADIDQTNRWIVWYSIRHSTGTYMAEAGNLAQTKEQLRQKRLESTMRYAQAPPESRRNTLNEIG